MKISTRKWVHLVLRKHLHFFIWEKFSFTGITCGDLRAASESSQQILSLVSEICSRWSIWVKQSEILRSVETSNYLFKIAQWADLPIYYHFSIAAQEYGKL